MSAKLWKLKKNVDYYYKLVNDVYLLNKTISN